MNIQRAAAALAALTILAGMPELTFAQTTGGQPVAVGSLSVRQAESIGNGEMTLPGSIDLSFKNSTDLAETEVLFELRGSDGYIGSIRDTGSFAPGVTIKHHFSNPNNLLDSATDATVARVTFADGTIWINEAYIDQAFPPQHVRFGPLPRQATQ